MVFVLSPAWDKEKNSEFLGGIEPKTFEFCAPMRNEQCLLRSAYMTRVLGLRKFQHISSLLHASARYVFCMFTLATVINIRRISGFLVKNCLVLCTIQSRAQYEKQIPCHRNQRVERSFEGISISFQASPIFFATAEPRYYYITGDEPEKKKSPKYESSSMKQLQYRMQKQNVCCSSK